MDGDIYVQHESQAAADKPCGINGSRKASGLSLDCTSHGFPNLFIMSGPQGGGGQFNFTRGIEGHTEYVIWMLKTLSEHGASVVDVRKEPENAYAEHCREADIRTRRLRDCLSYYNGDGTAEPGSLAYYGGPQKWHELRIAAQKSLEPYVFYALLTVKIVSWTRISLDFGSG